jgi:hypothetical protein
MLSENWDSKFAHTEKIETYAHVQSISASVCDKLYTEK